MLRVLIILFASLLFAFKTSAQDIHPGSKITSTKLVVGFPGISDEQINAIKNVYINIPEIQNATFVKADHNCMLIELSGNQVKFSVYAELIKLTHSIFNESLCYVKPVSAYNEISNNIQPGTSVLVK